MIWEYYNLICHRFGKQMQQAGFHVSPAVLIDCEVCWVSHYVAVVNSVNTAEEPSGFAFCINGPAGSFLVFWATFCYALLCVDGHCTLDEYGFFHTHSYTRPIGIPCAARGPVRKVNWFRFWIDNNDFYSSTVLYKVMELYSFKIVI